MGWEKGGRYFTRSKKIGGKVVREYVGTGRLAELVAEADALRREERRRRKEEPKLEEALSAGLEADLRELDYGAELLARAALLAAGYHQHRRGEWRKRRGQEPPRPGDGTPGQDSGGADGLGAPRRER